MFGIQVSCIRVATVSDTFFFDEEIHEYFTATLLTLQPNIGEKQNCFPLI